MQPSASITIELPLSSSSSSSRSTEGDPHSSSSAAAASPDTPRLRRYFNATKTWIRGPVPPLDVTFSPVFPALQRWPAQTFVRRFKRRRTQFAVLAAYLLVWLVLFIVVVHYSLFAASVEGIAPLQVGCSASLW